MSTAIHTTPTPNTKKDDAMNITNTINRLLAISSDWQGNVDPHGAEIRIYDGNAGAWFACDINDVAELCDQLEAGREDAYSLWCAETESRELVVVDSCGGIVADEVKEAGTLKIGQHVEGGAIGDGYDHGPIKRLAVSPDDGLAYASVMWANGGEAEWVPIEGLRDFDEARSRSAQHDYVSFFESLREAIDFEEHALGVGDEFLPAYAVAVKKGDAEATAAYWVWLLGQAEQIEEV